MTNATLRLKSAADEGAAKKKRDYVSQGDVPKMRLDEALKLAEALRDDFGLKPAAPHQLALAVDISPTSSRWQDISGASIAYGLTVGGYNAKSIAITALGKRIVSPTEEGEDRAAKLNASLIPRVPKEFFTRYNRAKFPQDKIAKNVLLEMGVPSARVDETLEILKDNGRSAGIILDTKTGPYVAIEVPEDAVSPDSSRPELSETPPPATEAGGNGAGVLSAAKAQSVDSAKSNNRVFVAHGKSKEIVEQLKKLLAFGKFEAVLAVEHETTARPVPKKVLEDMRSCFAGILHLCSEETVLDKGGNPQSRLNENVLIEIGAAMALYGDNFILLVQKGIHVPSNLQGLQVCWYDGEKLDMEATMKLLQAFNDFRRDS